jgi:hypothetical protein
VVCGSVNRAHRRFAISGDIPLKATGPVAEAVAPARVTPPALLKGRSSVRSPDDASLRQARACPAGHLQLPVVTIQPPPRGVRRQPLLLSQTGSWPRSTLIGADLGPAQPGWLKSRLERSGRRSGRRGARGPRRTTREGLSAILDPEPDPASLCIMGRRSRSTRTRASCPALMRVRVLQRLDRPARARHPGGVPENKPETPRAVTVRTLAHLGPRNRLDAHCASCRRSQRLDVQALISRYGPLPLELLRERLVCGRCGARRPELIMSWDISLAAPIFRSS